MPLTIIQPLRASAAQSSGTEFAIYKLQQDCHELVAQLNVSAAATDVGDTLDVYIDTSFDGGDTFVNIGRFTQVLGNGGAKKFVLAIKNDNPGASAVYNVTTDASAGVTRQIGFGDLIKYRGVVTNSGTVDASFTYAVLIFLK